LSPSEVKSFHEAKTKQGFIEPLFRALGWNFDDTSEVAPEEKASNGRVDYAFKLNGVSQFFLEAKPLKADLTSPDYVKQAVSYAYHKGVTWAVLTDFEEMRLFNAQQNKPFITLNCSEYLGKIDKLWLLSRESLKTGLLNKEAAEYGALPPALPIEKRLFTKLRQWREDLFNQLHAYNEKLSYSQIDEVIQRLFDRLIFIRTCEDRNIEGKRLLAAANQWKSSGYKGELIDELKTIFNEYNDIYDSELFDKHLTDQVDLVATTIEGILTGLYEIPGSLASYNFNDIDADVLGAVYEQYLGYVATKVKEKVEAQLKLGITDEETFEIISKKQRRKEQGIYYTPKFVTDYIVKETVGRFIKEHDYNEIRTIKILDPACGSGSFLIRAYDELLNYHAKQRNRSLNELDQKDRLPVLLANIYGVDLDMQAVEITRLNLLLRTLTEKGKLPYLSNNIREGNSLISGTEEELKKYFGDNWREKKPFKWEQKFKDIMAQGGFDVVIGNPPWIESKRMDTPDKSYYETAFHSMHGQYDIFNGFVEKGLQLLKSGGVLGFIMPSRFVMNPDYKPFREMLLMDTRIVDICDVGEHIFEGVEMPALIMILEKQQDAEYRNTNLVQIRTDVKNLAESEWKEYFVSQGRFLEEPNFLFTIYQPPEVDTLVSKIEKNSIRFGKLVNNARGVEIGKKSPLVSAEAIEAGYVPFLVGEDIDRYIILGHRYLKLGDTSVDYKSPELYKGEKIIVRKTGTGLRATLDNQNFYVIQVIYIFKPKTEGINLRFLLGLFNSKFMSFYYFTKFGEKEKKVFPHLRQGPILQFPIRRIDLDNPKDKKMHDDLVALVDRMLELNKRLAPIRDTYGYERDELLSEIKRTDAEIDQKVYQLYGLTEEEIQIIEVSLVSKSSSRSQ